MRKVKREDYFILAVFLMHFHSGQWSRGYRLLSKLHVRNMSSALEADARIQSYTSILSQHMRKVV